MRISDWSSDVCSSDLDCNVCLAPAVLCFKAGGKLADDAIAIEYLADGTVWFTTLVYCSDELAVLQLDTVVRDYDAGKVNRLLVTGHEVVIACDISRAVANLAERSEEHTSELQSLMRISYAVICSKQKKELIEQK